MPASARADSWASDWALVRKRMAISLGGVPWAIFAATARATPAASAGSSG